MVLIQPLGRINAESQKFTVPKITVFSSCNLPAKDNNFIDHDWKLAVSFAISGEFIRDLQLPTHERQPKITNWELTRGKP